MHILIVEDERALCDTIARSLRRLAYSVDCCYDGQSAAEMLAVERFDLVVLDLNLPGEDGMTVLRTLRERDRDTKVLILSARCEVADKVAGLDAGANDYLTKPFHLDELAARIRSLTLRRFTQSDVVLTCAELSFDTKARTASVRGETLSLTRKETGILEYLLLHQGRPVSQEELLEHVWDSGADGFGNSIRVHISALRKKLRAALGYDPIRNRIGEGYVMEAVAHHADDGGADRRDVCAHELSDRLFRQAVYGCDRQRHLGLQRDRIRCARRLRPAEQTAG